MSLSRRACACITVCFSTIISAGEACVDYQPKKAVLVVGAPRSGTSVTTGVLQRLGLPLGDNLTKPSSWNPKGDYEDAHIMEVNKKLIRKFGYCPRNMTGGPQTLRTHPFYKEAKKYVKQAIQQSFEGMNIFGLKHPRCSVLLPLYTESIKELGYEPHLIIVSRQIDDIIGSLNRSEKQKGDPYTKKEGHAFVNEFVRPIGRHSLDYPHVRIPFKEITQNTPRSIERMNRFLPELYTFEEKKDAIEQFVTRPKRV